MSFDINTNIASLEAQNYLEADNNYQNQTIQEVTSGLRIVNSGNDAAGLAIANGIGADVAVLTQGIQNANDGLATLQTIDGGMNNITQLLDRANTLATQSASGTFTGDRTVLDQEFQSVLSEINRQAQSIGLNTGGQFAQDLSVYIGGGRASGTTSAITNGSVSVNLTDATVDTQSLGLSGFTAQGVSTTDIGDGAGSTSVSSILANTTNVASEAQNGYTTFYFTGPGFANTTGNNQIAVSVNLAGVTDADTLAAAINSAIQAAGNGTSQQATAFKNANIQASVYTNPTNGKSSLQFTSSTAAFQVSAGDQLANALLGNIQGGSTPQPGQGVSIAASTAINTGQTALAATSANTNPETVNLGVTVGDTTHNVQLTIGAGEARATTLSDLATALAGTGVTAALNTSNQLVFTATTANQGQPVQVVASGDTSNVLGLGSFSGTGATPTYTSITAGAAPAAADTQNIQIAVGSQVVSLGDLSTGASEATAIAALNTALQGNSVTRAAGIIAQDNGSGDIQLVSNNNTSFRVNAYGSTSGGFGFTDGVNSANFGAASGAAQTTIAAGGSSSSGFLNYQPFITPGVSQTVTLTAADAQGQDHSISFSLSSANANNIDAALTTINSALQASNDSTLDQIVAVKQQQGGADGIEFISALNNFTLSLGSTASGSAAPADIQGISNGTGTASQGGPVITSAVLGSGATVDIGTQQNAENALTALTDAVTALGRAQAAVGKGENLFTYATNLAQSQLTNDTAAQAGIMDADLATEAGNLSKAQILVQAGTAALAQANSSPQAILALLRQ